MICRTSLEHVLGSVKLADCWRLRQLSKRVNEILVLRVTRVRVRFPVSDVPCYPPKSAPIEQSEERLGLESLRLVQFVTCSDNLCKFTRATLFEFWIGVILDKSVLHTLRANYVRVPEQVRTVKVIGEMCSAVGFSRVLRTCADTIVIRTFFNIQLGPPDSYKLYERLFSEHSEHTIAENIRHISETDLYSASAMVAPETVVLQSIRHQYSMMRNHSANLHELWPRYINMLLRRIASMKPRSFLCKTSLLLSSRKLHADTIRTLASSLSTFHGMLCESDDFCMSLLRQCPNKLDKLSVCADTSVDQTSSLFYPVLDAAERCPSVQRLWLQTDIFASHIVHVAEKQRLSAQLKHLVVSFFHPWSRWCTSPMTFPLLETLTIVTPWFGCINRIVERIFVSNCTSLDMLDEDGQWTVQSIFQPLKDLLVAPQLHTIRLVYTVDSSKTCPDKKKVLELSLPSMPWKIEIALNVDF